MQIKRNTDDQEKIKTRVSDVSFDDFKNALGISAKKYTDEQIENMRITADKIADMFFTHWLREKNVGMVVNEKEKI